MLKFIELCVQLRKGKAAKDGLHQHRAITQQVPNSNSLEVVVKRFLELADAKAKEAQSKAQKVRFSRILKAKLLGHT
jgi:translation initiation factor 3 subunit A